VGAGSATVGGAAASGPGGSSVAVALSYALPVDLPSTPAR